MLENISSKNDIQIYQNDIEIDNTDEGWFLYWKTSSSLWKGKLEKFPKSKPLFIPINWAHHYISDVNTFINNDSNKISQYDFGIKNSETNISEIVELTNELGLTAIFLFPITPIPILANGGLPSSLAKTPSISDNGILISVATTNNTIHRMYSFFDPRVYKAYGKFTQELSRYINEKNLNIHIALLNCGYLDKNNRFTSYFEDYSSAFENGLVKYMEVKRKDPESIKNSNTRISSNISSLINDCEHQREISNNELVKKFEFYEVIKDLYINTAKEAFKDCYEGIIDITFLGGTSFDILNRAIGTYEHSIRYFPQIIQAKNIDVLPCTLLLSKNIKQEIITKAINNFLDIPCVQSKLDGLKSYENDEFDFISLNFFHLYQSANPLINKLDLENMLDYVFQR